MKIDETVIFYTLQDHLDHRPTDKEFKRFLKFLENDIMEWINENARCFAEGGEDLSITGECK